MSESLSRYEENAILAYYQKIQSGEINVGRWIRMLYDVIVDGISEGRWFYDHRKAMNCLRFFERFCHHNKGVMAPQRIKLELWQRAALSIMFGIVDADGHRQFNEVFWVVGRKQGKTLIAGGVATYFMYAVGEYGSEIYFLAPKLDQADLCWQAYRFNVEHEPDLMKRTKSTKTGMVVKETNTTAKKLPFAERKSDGYNPMEFTADEVASWPAVKGLLQWESMMSGTGARAEPMGFAISSAGYVNDGLYDELFKRGTAFLMGNSKETHILPILYMIDDEEKWDDINELQKSLPGLGVSVSVKFILKEIEIAYESRSKRIEFLTKYCNIKQTLSSAWLSSATIKKSFNIGQKDESLLTGWQLQQYKAGKIDEDGNHFELMDFTRCYGIGGIDLSQTTDLTACTLLVQRGGIVYYFTQFFLPAAKLEEATARDGIPYDKYVERGWLKISGDNYVDYNDCYRWFVDLIEKYRIYVLQIGIDRYCAQYLQPQLEKYGFHCDTVFQGRNLTGVISTTEGMMMDGAIQSADGNELMKIHWQDAAMKMEQERNMRSLIKISRNAHVDGVAALLDAMCMRGNYWEQYKNRLVNEG